MSYKSDLPTPEAEIDKELHYHTEDVKHTLPTGDGYIQDPSQRKVETVRNAELYAALAEEKTEKWSRTSLKLYYSVFVAFCCACANGYDGSLMTAIIAMSHFQNTFHTGTTGGMVSVVFAMYTVGSMVGAPFAAVASDRFGRRKAMFAGACVIITGAIVAATSHHFAQLVVSRFILGFGIAIMTVAAPAYSQEIAPPQWRGRATGFYNTGWFGGSIPAAAVTYGCNFINSNRSWQVPLILQSFACVIVMVSVFFIPESPRFLMANGREEEAHAFLTKYHGNGKSDSKLVSLQIAEMREGIRQDGIDKTWWDYRPLFNNHNGRWRMAQVLMISIFGQFSGNGLGYFNTVIYANLGVSSVSQQLAYNLLNSIVSCIGAMTAVFLTDRMPRRKVLVIGTFTCAVMLAINAGLSAVLDGQVTSEKITGKPVSKSVAQGALAAYFMFNVIFSFTYTPLQGVIPVESLETTTRAKGLAGSGIIVSAFGFINSFAGPYALGNIGYRYVYVFVGWDVIESGLWYMFGVESQGRTLEQLEWVYNQPNPVKASLKVDKVIVQADGRVTEKVEL